MTPKRKWIRRASTQRARDLRIYAQRRKWFLAANPWCEWGLKQNPPIYIRSEQVHHRRGRIGRLLLMEEWWSAVSAVGHDWINRNPEAARKLGLLCQKGEWNTVPRLAA